MTGKLRIREAPPIVEITWLDSHSWSGWRITEDAENFCRESLARITTSGSLLREDDELIVVAQTVTTTFLNPEKDDVTTSIDNLMRIPKCCILKRRVLKKGKVPWKS